MIVRVQYVIDIYNGADNFSFSGGGAVRLLADPGVALVRGCVDRSDARVLSKNNKEVLLGVQAEEPLHAPLDDLHDVSDHAGLRGVLSDPVSNLLAVHAKEGRRAGVDREGLRRRVDQRAD